MNKLIIFMLLLREAIVVHSQMCSKDFVQAQISRATKIGGSCLTIAISLRLPALGRTYFDTEVYGDKELKIAAVNKIKQTVRNIILKDSSLAPKFLKIAINDALGYDKVTNSGGADGSILLEQSMDTNKGLEDAISELVKIKQGLQRTLSVSFADICAFAGAEALESVGSERIPIQLGRFDSKSANNKISAVPWTTPTSTDILTAFLGSGLDVNAVVLLLGAVGEISRIVDESKQTFSSTVTSEDEFEPQPFVPVTFGARDGIYGQKVGKTDFGSGYFRNLLKEQLPQDALGTTLISNPTTKTIVAKYANNDAGYCRDLINAYLKLTRLGEVYSTRNS